jgi:hypothetical protein
MPGAIKITLNVGNVQSFIFKPGDEGPFYFSSAERETKKDDTMLEGTKTRYLTEKELENSLPTKVLKCEAQQSDCNSCAEKTPYK